MAKDPVSHCVNNHEYTPENTSIGKDGKRRCRQCARDRDRRRPFTDARKAYLKNYQRGWVAQRRAEYLADKKCVRCGSRDWLEIDHINPEQKLSSRIWSWSVERRHAELAKCQILCHKHHAEKTHAQRLENIDTSHGTDWSYRKAKCRCALCRAGHASRRREERAAKRLQEQQNARPQS